MKKVLLLCAAVMLLSGHTLASAAETKVPAGKENLVLDSMSKAKQASGKKVLKGPVPFAHQAHADKVACADCHHKEKPGETPKACSSCHTDKKGDAPKIDDAFHGGENDSMPALQSCIGCHSRNVSTASNAPRERKPCEACHSLLKK
jgi:hypothetical protein